MLKGKGILTPVQRRVILAIAQLQDFTHFYLPDGTALAKFYLGHRKSYDLDLFIAKRGLVLPFSRQAEDCWREQLFMIVVARRSSKNIDARSSIQLEQSENSLSLQA